MDKTNLLDDAAMRALGFEHNDEGYYHVWLPALRMMNLPKGSDLFKEIYNLGVREGATRKMEQIRQALGL